MPHTKRGPVKATTATKFQMGIARSVTKSQGITVAKAHAALRRAINNHANDDVLTVKADDLLAASRRARSSATKPKKR